MAIKIPIFADYNDRGVKNAEASFASFGRSVGNITKKAAAAFATIGVAAAAGAVKAIDMASNLAESQSKVAQIFGESGAAIQAFSKTAATSLGLSEQNVLDAAGTFGIFGKAAGLGGTDLSDFSNQFTTLSSDLASFNNTSPEDAINAIGSALRGEMEPIRRYGVMLDDAAIKAEAMSQGLYDGKGALSQQAKILAVTALVYKKTGDAQGDFARTSGGLANQTKIMKAQLTNAATTIGTALLPIAIKLAGFFANKVIPAVEKLSEVFSEKGLAGVLDLAKAQLPKLQAAFSSLWGWITNVGVPKFVALMQSLGKALIDWIGPRIGPAINKLGEWLAAAGNWIINTGLPLLVDYLIKMGNALVEWIEPRIQPAIKKLSELITSLGVWLVTKGLPQLAYQAAKLAGALIGWVAKVLPDIIKGLGDAIIRAAGQLVQLGVDMGKQIAKGIGKGISKNVGGGILGNIFGGGIDLAPNIPFLSNGGIVSRPTLAVIGESGPEAVVPLSGRNAGMGMGTTNYITINSGADPQAVVRALQNYNRTAGPVPVNTRAN